MEPPLYTLKIKNIKERAALIYNPAVSFKMAESMCTTKPLPFVRIAQEFGEKTQRNA
jgi:hypothetical protein